MWRGRAARLVALFLVWGSHAYEAHTQQGRPADAHRQGRLFHHASHWLSESFLGPTAALRMSHATRQPQRNVRLRASWDFKSSRCSRRQDTRAHPHDTRRLARVLSGASCAVCPRVSLGSGTVGHQPMIGRRPSDPLPPDLASLIARLWQGDFPRAAPPETAAGAPSTAPPPGHIADGQQARP